MDAYESLLHVEAEIADWELNEGFHSGDGEYQRLLEKRDELREIINQEADEIWTRRSA